MRRRPVRVAQPERGEYYVRKRSADRRSRVASWRRHRDGRSQVTISAWRAAMILDRKQVKWVMSTGMAGVLLLLGYVIYALRSANGPRGGSVTGLIFGSIGTAVFLFECLLSLRKKYPASPIGRVQTWLRAHVWL